ncbi:MAG: 50S ribosome-binding GTPase [Chloroflexota bacterium]|nr:50S ribosome-binding GTPase [Chloroflexota bacterium]
MKLDSCLGNLREAVDAARTLGLDASAAEAVVQRAEMRLGFAGSTYVLALAGGTGVGKSTLLNALAGRMVSPVRAIRPTTGEPVAWVANARRHELAPMLQWLGARHVVGHAVQELAHVAIIDLPDFDSVFVEHRATVETLLPRVDALAWILDPEKYDDARLHDGYLRPLARHSDRFLFVLNKADRLNDGQADEVRADLERRLAADGIDGPPIFVVSARDASGEFQGLRDALAAAADAKAVIADKLRVDALIAGRQLAIQAGLDGGHGGPLVSPDRRAAALAAATAGALETVDVAEMSGQAQAAVRERSRRVGSGIVGRTMSLFSRASGRERRRADPVAFLRGWRSRGTLARAANPIRQLASEVALSAPPAWRPRLMELSGAGTIEASVEQALDRVAADQVRAATPPRSGLWPLLGGLQLVATAIFLIALVWLVMLVLVPGMRVSTIDVPVLGAVPAPLLLLAVGALGSYLASLVLTTHADVAGRRWAGAIAEEVRQAVGRAVDEHVMRPIDELEQVRGDLRAAIQRLTITCGEDDA